MKIEPRAFWPKFILLETGGFTPWSLFDTSFDLTVEGPYSYAIGATNSLLRLSIHPSAKSRKNFE